MNRKELTLSGGFDDLQLKTTFWSPWFIQKTFSALTLTARGSTLVGRI